MASITKTHICVEQLSLSLLAEMRARQGERVLLKACTKKYTTEKNGVQRSIAKYIREENIYEL